MYAYGVWGIYLQGFVRNVQKIKKILYLISREPKGGITMKTY
jgi:hypothetical protein